MLCFALCGVLAAAWVVSTRWTAFVMAQFGDSVGLRGGMVFCIWTSGSLRQSLASTSGLPVELYWNRHVAQRQTPIEWWPTFAGKGGRHFVGVPLWMPFVALGAGGGGLVYAARRMRRREGCPRCGYDVRGLSSGVCPECGAARVERSTAA